MRKSCLNFSILHQYRNDNWNLEFSVINRLIRWEILAFSSSHGKFIFSGHSDAKEQFSLFGGDHKTQGEMPPESWKGVSFVDRAGSIASFLSFSGWLSMDNPIVLFQKDIYICKMGLILPPEVVVKIKYNHIFEYILWRLKHYVSFSKWVEKGYYISWESFCHC